MRSEAKNIGDFQFFLKNLSDVLFRGGRLFYGWIAALILLLLIGIMGYIFQMQAGHAVTNMREQVSWGFYIANFSFLVGVAAAAVLLVIPAYLYHFKAIKKPTCKKVFGKTPFAIEITASYIPAVDGIFAFRKRCHNTLCCSNSNSGGQIQVFTSAISFCTHSQ